MYLKARWYSVRRYTSGFYSLYPFLELVKNVGVNIPTTVLDHSGFVPSDVDVTCLSMKTKSLAILRCEKSDCPSQKSCSVCEIVYGILFPTLTGQSSGSNAIKLWLSSLPLLVVGVEAAEASLREPWAFAAQVRG